MKALITGASSGLGMDMSLLIANKYDEIVIVGRDEKRLAETEAKLKEINNNLIVKSYAMDLTIKENLDKLYEENKDVDLLINNAGFGDYGKFDETSLDKDINMINTNILALHVLTKLYVGQMIKKDSGHILNVASIAAFMPGPLMATYYASKAYVRSLSEAIRVELKKRKSKVKISILCPGPTKTRFWNNANYDIKYNNADSAYVAKYAIKHLNRFYIVPTLPIKMARFFSKFIGTNFVGKIIYNIQKKRK